MDEICGFIDAGSIAHGPELRKEFGIIQEFESIKGLFGITRTMIEGNSEIKNVFAADVASSLLDESMSFRFLGLCVVLGKNARS